MLAGLLDVLRIRVEAVDEVAVVGTQGGGQLAVAAADVDHQAALDAGGVEDFLRRRSRGRDGRGEKRQYHTCTRRCSSGQHCIILLSFVRCRPRSTQLRRSNLGQF